VENIGRAFTYPFDDREWLPKIVIGGVILVVPILNFAFFGYALTVMQAVMENRLADLPDWSDFSTKWKRGLYIFLAALIYGLPAYLLVACAYVPLIIASSQPSDSEGALALLSLSLMCVAVILVMVYALLVLLIAPFLAGMYIQADEFKAFFRLRGAFDMLKANLGDAVIILLLTIVASIIGSLGVYFCVIPMIFTLPYSYLIIAHLYGQLYRQAEATRSLKQLAS